MINQPTKTDDLCMRAHAPFLSREAHARAQSQSQFQTLALALQQVRRNCFTSIHLPTSFLRLHPSSPFSRVRLEAFEVLVLLIWRIIIEKEICTERSQSKPSNPRVLKWPSYVCLQCPIIGGEATQPSTSYAHWYATDYSDAVIKC
jgi:hypothetical protein